MFVMQVFFYCSLMASDPHQLVLRLSQLLQEMCELLKVRLLSEVLADPTIEQSHNFAKSKLLADFLLVLCCEVQVVLSIIFEFIT